MTIADVDGRQYNINQFCGFPISEAGKVLAHIALSGAEEVIVRDVLREIRQRLRFLNEVGLGYLQLDRESGTLSGGEAQRIRLATQIGQAWPACCMCSMNRASAFISVTMTGSSGRSGALRDLGNSVIVVEHDEDTIRAADHVLDLGPARDPAAAKSSRRERPMKSWKAKTRSPGNISRTAQDPGAAPSCSSAARIATRRRDRRWLADLFGAPREQSEKHRCRDSARLPDLRNRRLGKRKIHAGR